MEEKRNQSRVTGAVLKWTALLSMLMDHAAILLLPYGTLYLVLRSIGRLAFPLFLFLLLEGFEHSRDRRRYLLRLLLFALISEWPFDLAFIGFRSARIAFSAQNVFFTLAIGFGCLMLMDWFDARSGADWERRLGMGLSVAAGALLAQLINSDYGAVGVIALALAFLLRLYRRKRGEQERPWIWLGLERAALVLPLLLGYYGETWALAALPLLCLYNGEKGRQPVKWFFYLFYPLHMLLLLGLRMLIWH